MWLLYGLSGRSRCYPVRHKEGLPVSSLEDVLGHTSPATHAVQDVCAIDLVPRFACQARVKEAPGELAETPGVQPTHPPVRGRPTNKIKRLRKDRNAIYETV